MENPRSSHVSDSTVFTDALELPGAERAAYLARACAGDPERHARVEALLQAHGESPVFFQTVAREAAVPADPAGPGDHIGRYKLLLKLGEGGCGVVYMAEQEEPVRRRVALKIIKAGMDTREVVARFEAERQALALMDHPGIARVLDGGATVSGRPYFVMELVRGVPITKYCNESTLPTRARLELFMQVCHAVQHAHQKGVIHRDIKPSNILVTLHDNVAAPKVIDFGIAKATHGRLTDATLFTAYSQFLGTPAYMSPEQAEMSGLDIDTRSDVYSLGVLLYELLTGRLPFDPKSLQNPSLDEVRRIIREVEPRKPSTHLETLGDADRATVAGQRGTDPAKLRLLLAGDLDWIVLKALEKNRARRYETPTALAEDIVRHLHDEPVSARPPGTLYRIGKFARRHRVGVAGGVSVFLALVAGTIVSVAQAIRATQAEHAAIAERSKAVNSRLRAENLLEFMLEDLRTEVKKVGKLDLLDMVGEQATSYFASLDPRDTNDTALLQQAKTLRQIGEVQFAKARYDQAMQSFTAALARISALVHRQPRNGDMLFERGQAEYWIGYVYLKRRQLPAVRQWFTRYRATALALAALEPTNPRSLSELAYGDHNLAVLELDEAKLESARVRFLAEAETLNQMIAADPKDLELKLRLADAHSRLGSIAEQLGDYAESLARFAERIRLTEALVQAEPTARAKERLADARARRATLLALTGRRSESLRERTRARDILDALVAGDPQNVSNLRVAQSCRVNEAQLLRADKKIDIAGKLIAETREQLEKLAVGAPDDRQLLKSLGTACRIQGEILAESGQAGSEACIARAVEIGGRLQGLASLNEEFLAEHAMARVIAGSIAERNGNRAEASAEWRRAVELLGGRVVQSNYWRILDPAARALACLGETARARSVVQRLEAFGYVPLEPWPGSIHPPATLTTQPHP